MNLIVDTNIVFSAMWNTHSRIAHILTNQDFNLNFFSPSYLLLEISNHQEKLSKRLNLNLEEFLELQHLVTRRIRFIAEDQISEDNWINADELTRNVDSDDIAFVALALGDL